jgi:hypothetical protein
MSIRKCKMASAWIALGVLALSATFSSEARAQASAVDPAATQILKRMTDYLGGLKQFSVKTQNTIEERLGSGQRVDIDVSASIIVSRPNKLYAERKGDLVDQIFFYDGKTLTLYNPSDKVYATKPVPGTYEGMLAFARQSLGLVIPAGDLIYPNAYPLLMQDVTLAVLVGKAFVGGVRCDHLLFSRPGVDFQLWVADSDRPLPRKFVVVGTGTPALASVVTVMSDWNTAPDAADARFTFVPTPGAKTISFMPLESSSGSNR